MKSLFNIFNRDKKQYTHKKGVGETVVSIDFKWVHSIKFNLIPDLKGNKVEFFTALKNQNFYFENVQWSIESTNYKTHRFHGPYPIDEISHESYVSVNLNQAKELLNLTMDNSNFNNDFPFNQKFRKEALELLQTSLTDKNEIYWLNKKFEIGQAEWRYNFWAEFVARNDSEMTYITIGQD